MISASVANISRILDQHKSIMAGGGSVIKHISSIFDNSATVAYIPTGVVASGPIQIEALLGEYSRQSACIQSEQILSRTVATNQVVEESLLTVNHKDTINWLLPSVRPTGKEINVALVTVVEFNEVGKIISKRVYWDQASVLRQIGILPKSLYCRSNTSEVILPIVGSEVAARFYAGGAEEHLSEKMDQVEVSSDSGAENKRLNPKRNESDNIFSDEPVSFRPSSRVLSRPGGKSSDIFGLSAPESTVTAQKAHLPAPGGPALNLFDDAPSNATSTDHHRRDPNYTNNEEIQHRQSRPYSGESNKSQFSIGRSDTQEPEQERHTGRRQAPQSMQTSFSFSDGSVEGMASAAPVRSGRRDPNAQSQESIHRPSSRVLSRPGGKQNFSFA